MNPVELYYEVKALFNISEEAFNIFYEYKQRENKNFQNVLCVCVSRNECQRFFRKTLENTDNIKYDTDKKEIYFRDKIVKFKSIEEIKDKKEYLGSRYSEIRFLS